MDSSILITLTIAISGLIILQLLPGHQYQQKTLKRVKENCEGKIKAKGTVIKSFQSEKGNRIGIISGKDAQSLLMLEERPVYPGDRVEIKGRASKYRKQCFIFPDRLKVI